MGFLGVRSRAILETASRIARRDLRGHSDTEMARESKSKEMDSNMQSSCATGWPKSSGELFDAVSITGFLSEGIASWRSYENENRRRSGLQGFGSLSSLRHRGRNIHNH